MQTTSDKERVPGFFLIEDVDFVKKNKGPKGLEKLKKLVPELNLEKISPIRKYLLSNEIALLRAAAIVVYGDDSPASWEKLGVHDYETVANSSLGHILLSLFGKSFADLVKNGARLFFYFAPFITFTCSNLSEHGATFTVENDPYPKEYYLGLFLSLLKSVSDTGKITVKEAGPKKHIYYLKL